MKKLLTYLLMGISFVAGLYGCASENGFVKYHTKHPATSASYCGLWYPVQSFTRDSVIYKPGDVIPGPVQYVVVDCDSVLAANKMTGNTAPSNSIVRMPCPPPTHQVDTIYEDKFTQVENTAKAEGLQGQVTERDKKIATLTAQKRMFEYWAFIASGLIVASLIIKYLKSRIP